MERYGNDVLDEAKAIARLFGGDRTRIAGWVYFWNTSELAILWNGKRGAASFIAPPLRPEILAKARPATPIEVINFLESLSTDTLDDPE